MNKKNLISCAFTGHRPSRFPFGYDESHPACKQLKQSIKNQIVRLYKRGVKIFYTGCALGVDMWAGEAVISLKQQYDIDLICVVPFRGQASAWKPEQQRRHSQMLENSTVFILSEKYTKECYFERNRFLVDNSDVLLAVCRRYANDSSVTGYTINYAIQNKKPVLLIDPDSLQLYVWQYNK